MAENDKKISRVPATRYDPVKNDSPGASAGHERRVGRATAANHDPDEGGAQGYSGQPGNKVKRAAAISFDPSENDVPILTAFGEGYLADKIVSLAKESGVPVLPEPSLASMLSRISVGDEISPELYEAVAKVLTFVSEIDRSYADKLKRGWDK